MLENHRLVVDRHEEQRTVVELDGKDFLDLPRWMLPPETRADDVIAVQVEAEGGRAVVTLLRDEAATARAQQTAREAIDRLRSRDPGGDMRL